MAADLNLLRALLEEELAKSAGRGPASQQLGERQPASFDFTANSSPLMPANSSSDPMSPLLDYFKNATTQSETSVTDPAVAAGIAKSQRKGENNRKTGLDIQRKVIEVVPGTIDLGADSKIGQAIAGSPAYKAQAEDLADYESLGADLLRMSAEQPIQTDLTPALALSDTFFGSNFASRYDAPKRDDFYKRLSDYMAQKSKLKNELTERYRELASAAKADGTTTQTIGRLMDAFGLERGYGGVGAPQFNPFQLQPDEKIKQDALNKFNADVKYFDEKIGAAGLILDEMKQTGQGAKLNLKTVETQLAKLGGEVGALSTYDVKGRSTSQAWGDRINQYIQRAKDGTFTKDNAIAVREIAESMRNRWITLRRDFSQERARQVEQTFPRIIKSGDMLPSFDNPALKETPIGSPVGTVWKGKYKKVKAGSDSDSDTWAPVEAKAAPETTPKEASK